MTEPSHARGREDLVVWLKHLENRSRHTTDRNDPVATYDFTWMWRELNVDHLLEYISAVVTDRMN